MARRQFLRDGGAGLMLLAGGGAALHNGAALAQERKAKSSGPTVLEDMGAWIAATRYEELSPATVRKVKNLLLDTFGCAIGAVDGPPVKAARGVIRMRGGNPQATVIGTGWKTSCDEAAFLNALQIRYLDFNDYTAFGYPHHPSINLASALAVAEMRRLSGKDLILGLTLGYDVHIRIRDASERRGFDMPSIEAQYASAACAARLLGLDARGIANALAIAASNANTLSEVRAGDELTNAKGAAEAMAVRSGTFAALLSQAGVQYPLTIMDGEFSYDRLVSRGLKQDLLRKRSGEFQIMKSCMKMWPSIGTSQAPIAAALQLREKGVRAADIVSVTMYMSEFGYDQQLGFLDHEINTREHADHSAPYCVTRAFLDGDVRIEDFHDPRFREPAAKEFMKRIKVVADPALTTSGGDILGCNMEVTLKDGSVRRAEMPFAPGSIQNPATDKEIETKFFDLAEGVIGKSGAERARDAILSIDSKPTLDGLLALLKPIKRSA
ncbi:MmgE/PrpD family protein [Novosphingobium flavum]|uniref:MmgE/PrpD family protein n=1 Tax=Novosphingobium flavum TaxID=1778672 RepID=A0A7X1KLA1_9SPHN|nr:MmgE/PrpD family protein [Novosphingobium flavum]MBC2665381.1 MmgE/PrpD family protein [Novosphingobium flavum]